MVLSMNTTESVNNLVYVPMVADYLHHGHINIINQAKKFGPVTIGLMTDEAAASYKRVPLLSYEERKKIVEGLHGVDQVVSQDQLDYVPAILKYRPAFFVHGTDWRSGVQKNARNRVLEAMASIGGSVIEPEYTEGISSTKIINNLLSAGISPERRLSRLRQIINAKPWARGIEAHSGLTGIIADSTVVEADGELRSFDFIWLSQSY